MPVFMYASKAKNWNRAFFFNKLEFADSRSHKLEDDTAELGHYDETAHWKEYFFFPAK